MKLVGMMPVRNEAWCLGLTARAALRWCDELVILAHACNESTLDLVARIAKENDPHIVAVYDEKPAWDEMRHRQAMLELARAVGATHVAIVDADEILTGNLLPRIRDHIEQMPRGYILQLPGYNLRDGIQQYHANGVWGYRWFSVAFADAPCLYWGGDQFHHREPFSTGNELQPYRPIAQRDGGVMHLWGASERRLRAKHALYQMTESLRWPEKGREDIRALYSMAIHGQSHMPASRWEFAAVPPTWWDAYADLMPHLDVDAEPWQEAEVRRLIAQYGATRFAGLDLFGLA